MQSGKDPRLNYSQRTIEQEVYLGNLPDDITEEHLMNKFEKDFDFLTFRGLIKKGVKSFCFIDCGSIENARKFQSITNGLIINGRKLIVRCQEGRDVKTDQSSEDYKESASAKSPQRPYKTNPRFLRERPVQRDDTEGQNLSPQYVSHKDGIPPPLKPIPHGTRLPPLKPITHQPTMPPLKTVPRNRGGGQSWEKHATERLGDEDENLHRKVNPGPCRQSTEVIQPMPELRPLPESNDMSSIKPAAYSGRYASCSSYSFERCVRNTNRAPLQNHHYTPNLGVRENQHGLSDRFSSFSKQGQRYDTSPRNFRQNFIQQPDYSEIEDPALDFEIPDGAVVLSVSNFPYRTTEDMIFKLFEDFQPLDVRMVCNFPCDGNLTEALVVLPDEDAASDAIMNLDNTQYKQRIILVTDINDDTILDELEKLNVG